MRDCCHVVSLLDGVRAQDRPPGDPSSHHVGVITENTQRVGRHCARGHMQHRRSELASDLVHIRQHQQQSLRTGEAARLRTGLKRTMQSASSTGFGLHLNDSRHLAPNVSLPLRTPHVGQFSHRRRRGDRVDRTDITQPVSDGGGGLITVNTVPPGSGVWHRLGGFGVVAS